MNTKKSKIRNLISGLLLVILVGITSVAVFSMMPGSKKSQSEVVATIEGQPVTNTELHHWMLLNKANVYNQFYRSHDATYDDGFWTKQFDGKTPLEMLKSQALDEAIQFKLKQRLAKELGIHTIMDFDELMRERERINERRKQKVKDKQSVYGPVSLTSRNFVMKMHDEMVQSTKTALSATDFKIADKEMKRLYSEYKSERDETGRNKNKVPPYEDFRAIRQMEHTKEKYDQLIEEMRANAEIKIIDPIYKKLRL